MKVEVDADELCELRRRAEAVVQIGCAADGKVYAGMSVESIGRVSGIIQENTRLKKELDEALAEMSELRKIGKELKDRADMVYEWWRDAERKITNLMRLGGCK